MSGDLGRCTAVFTSDGDNHRAGERCGDKATIIVTVGLVEYPMCRYHAKQTMEEFKNPLLPIKSRVVPNPKPQHPAPSTEEV